MERRFLLFVVISIAILAANVWIQSLLRDDDAQLAQEKAKAAAKKEKAKQEAKGDQAAADGQKDEAKKDEPAEEDDADAVPAVAAEPKVADDEPLAWLTLGSVAEEGSFLVTFINEGAAIERIELGGTRYRDLDIKSGYLGYLAPEDVPGGVRINVVGPGTPAAEAGLRGVQYRTKDGATELDDDGKPLVSQPGDVIVSVDDKPVASTAELYRILATTKPGDEINIGYLRDGKKQTAAIELTRRPMEVVRPETLPPNRNIPEPLQTVTSGQPHDPLSFLFTLWQIDDQELSTSDDEQKNIDQELPGVRLRKAKWHGRKVDDYTVEFSRELADYGLRVVKRYRLPKPDENLPGYQLKLEVEIHNTGDAARSVAYQLDGPTGLPTAGWWYNSRISRDWGAMGVRNAALLLQGSDPAQITPMQLGEGALDPPYRSEAPDLLMAYAGVDAQYFACALVPEPFRDRPQWLAQITGILVGKLPEDPAYQTLGNVSCRLVSVEQQLEPGGEPLAHSYTVFAGPKRPDLLAQYGDPADNLGELIYYGWPIWGVVARLMTTVLHFFYNLIGNYGVAIILLTVVVRGCLFPLSRKQALSAQKMQELKPEMDKINEKYKGKPEEKTRAMQALWRKHNYNPLSGCLLVFLQLPIFLGLYRALMIDVELWQAPLISESIRWCSNLAAPDMLLYWRDWPFMPSMITAYRGFGSLGPYLNILPLLTVGLFLWQQKMFMPPATDDNSKMQQKMMKYMMVLIGFMFFTVPSGLCIYFIASSLWGIAERKLLPKAIPASQASADAGKTKPAAAVGSNGAAARRARRKQRGGK